MAHNPLIPVAEATLGLVLEQDHPITPRAMHDTWNNNVNILHAANRAFDLEQGMSALRVAAIKHVLDEYGDAIGTGRDAEHVAEHTPKTLAARAAMLEQQVKRCARALEAVRNQEAQLKLSADLERLTGSVSA